MQFQFYGAFMLNNGSVWKMRHISVYYDKVVKLYSILQDEPCGDSILDLHNNPFSSFLSKTPDILKKDREVLF